MSGLSVGTTKPAESKAQELDGNLKLNIMSDDKTTTSAGYEDEPDLAHLDIDNELNDLLHHEDSGPLGKLQKSKDIKHEERGGPLDKSINGGNHLLNDHTASNTHSPRPISELEYKSKSSEAQQIIRRSSSLVPITSEAALGSLKHQEEEENSRISAYARLDFENFTFFVQTLQVVLGRKSNDEFQTSHHAVDVHLSSKKAISRRHAKIFYNFGTQRFELSILGRNGAFVDELFVEKGMTVPLVDGTRIQIGDIPFAFVLPSIEPHENDEIKHNLSKPMNPSDAINLRSNLYSTSTSPTPKPSKKVKPTRKDSRVSISSEESHSRSNSRAKLPRRLSDARRKSLASATNDEINEILNALGAHSIDAIAEDNDELIDVQIQAILDNSRNSHHDIDKHLKLPHYNDSAIEDEEDEIDKLVKQHNLEQGVNLDEDSHEHSLDDGNLSMDMLDQEFATLAPLISAHNQDLDSSKKLLEARKAQAKRLGNGKKSFNKLTGANIPVQANGLSRTTPLMGKPASIQPPANRLYGRPTPGVYNTPTYPLGADDPMAYSLPAMGQHVNRLLPPRPLPPKLEVPVHTITSIEVKPSLVPQRSITVNESVMKLAPICVFKSLEPPSLKPKIPRRNRDSSIIKKTTKSVYSAEEIPEQYKIKPNVSFPEMITSVLRSNTNERGLTMLEIIQAIRDFYPYYKYCPDGWQFSVIHSVKLTKVYKRVLKTGPQSEWTWAMDDTYIDQREKVRIKQQEAIAAKVKAAALKAEELKQKQRLEAQQYATQNLVGRSYGSPYSGPYTSTNVRIPPSQFPSQLHQKQTMVPINGQKPKTIAELASEITRDGGTAPKAPMYFKPGITGDSGYLAQSPLNHLNRSPITSTSLPSGILTSAIPSSSAAVSIPPHTKPVNLPQAHPHAPSSSSQSPNTIKAQLAANRSQSPPQPLKTPTPTTPKPPVMNSDTKKSLAYLQKELFVLYKARKLSYNTATTTEIITKALATTIAQVNVIGAKAGCGDNALSFLVEKAPQQVSKILDIALTKSIKEKQGVLSKHPSRDSTPQPPSTQSTPQPAAKVSAVSPATPAVPTPDFASPKVAEPVTLKDTIPKKEDPVVISAAASSPSPAQNSNMSKPPLFGGLSKPPSFHGKGDQPTLSRPTYSGPGARPQPFSKPGALSRPPQFLSNKPTKVEDSEKEAAKRPLEGGNESPSKAVKLE